MGHRRPLLPGPGAAPRGNSRLARPLVHARRSADHGDGDECRIADAVGQAQSLSGKARRRRERRARGPADRRGEPAGKYRPDRRPGQQLQGDNERRHHLQEHDDRVKADRAPCGKK